MTIQDLQKKYDLPKEDFWEHKQSGQWILTHKAVEKIAEKEGIKIVDMEPLNSEMDLVRFKVTMSTPNGGQIISIGEADRNNCISQYLGCMAEKRGIDRCVLKIINAYQYNIASEVEAEDYRKPDLISEQSIEDEAEYSGLPIIDESKKKSKTSKNDLTCPYCKKEVMDKRVWKDGVLACAISPKGNNLPSFKCVDNDDYQNPTCKFASWELTPLEAGLEQPEVAPHHDKKPTDFNKPLAAQ